MIRPSDQIEYPRFSADVRDVFAGEKTRVNEKKTKMKSLRVK